MPYTQTTWVNNAPPAINAANLQKIEAGLAHASLDYNVQDYGAVGDGVTDDTAAIQTAFNSVNPGGTVSIPAATYLISAPINVTTRCQVIGEDSRAATLKAKNPGFTGSQMVRNWVDADWAGGETNHRIAPANAVLSGTHSFNYYPRFEGVGFNANGITNIAMLSWTSPQETSWIRDIVFDTGVVSESGNKGIWGIDLQTGSTAQSSFNQVAIDNVVFYEYGWERFLSVDGNVGGGSDVHVSNMTTSPAITYHSQVYVNNVYDVRVDNSNLEGIPDAASNAACYLVNARGFSFTDGSVSVNAATHARPFVQSTFLAPLLRGVATIIQGAGPWYSNHWIVDAYNTIDFESGTIGGVSIIGAEYMNYYDGNLITGQNYDGSRFGSSYFSAFGRGGVSTQTPGAVTTVNIAHGMGRAPSTATVTPANANARGAPSMHATFDATNVILNFSAALTAATSYSWNWHIFP